MWQKHVKLKGNRALFSYLNKSGVDAILRDDCGSILLAVCNVVNGVCTVDMVEALAILKGLQFISHMGIQSLMVKSDSQIIVVTLNSSDVDLSAQGAILAYIKHLYSRFQVIEFRLHIPRKAIYYSGNVYVLLYVGRAYGQKRYMISGKMLFLIKQFRKKLVT